VDRPTTRIVIHKLVEDTMEAVRRLLPARAGEARVVMVPWVLRERDTIACSPILPTAGTIGIVTARTSIPNRVTNNRGTL
jgi:hypothetical protein